MTYGTHRAGMQNRMRWRSRIRDWEFGVFVYGNGARAFAGRTTEEAESKRDRYERRKGAA